MRSSTARLSAVRPKGFTLIELMIVVAIVGILATVAFPSFNSYLVKSRRAEAKAMLQQVAMWMERNQAATYRYDRDLENGSINNARLTALGFDRTPATGTMHYQIQFAAISANAFVVSATPQGGQATDDATCGTLAISSSGLRGKLDGASVKADPTTEDCWRR
ncbi:type IV pilin protein [Ideonella sp.]|jgi:type IV pilus assembly protein PilE|uniref:type IV pilin protein n=1 Tax=Ideonella sp. TaxID=1929293 RepID=UPI0037BF03C8